MRMRIYAVSILLLGSAIGIAGVARGAATAPADDAVVGAHARTLDAEV